MSSYMVSTPHIDALVTAALTPHGIYGHMRSYFWQGKECEVTEDTAGRIGAALLAENRHSVNYKYNEDELTAAEAYTFTRLPGTPAPIDVLKAIDGYAYQAGDDEAHWETSEARAFCDALRTVWVHRLPGWDGSRAWAIDNPQFFATGANR